MSKIEEPAIIQDENISKREDDVSSGTASQELDLEYLNDRKRNKQLVRRFDLRILPLCAWIYLLNYLDRGNIGNAKVLNEETGDSLMQQTRLTGTQYAIVLTLFSIAYTVFEVPSNWIMKNYVCPSIWLAVLLFCWGAFTLGFAGVQNYPQVLVLRFFIGVFEAGFFPGIVYLITLWYRVEERSLRIAFVLASATAAGAFGGCVAFGVGYMNGIGGLEGFRWLSIIEGLITVLSTIPVFLTLPDYPSRARFLSEDEKKYAEDRLKISGGGLIKAKATRKEVEETCFSPRMLLHYLAYTLDCVPLGSLTFFTPTIVTGLGYTSITAQLLTVPPWIVGYIICLLLAWTADRFNARGLTVIASSTLGGIGWLTAGLLPATAYTSRYGCLILCACGAFPSAGPLSAWVSCNSPSLATVAIAVALNNSGAGIGQVITQWVWKSGEAGRGYPTGNFTCAGCSFAVVGIAAVLRVWYGRMNRMGKEDARGERRTWML